MLMSQNALYSNRIQLISYGDKVFIGDYKVFSHFNRSIIFYDKDRLIFLVNREIGAGPLNIVVRNFHFKKTKHLKITKHTIQIDDYQADKISIKQYVSTINFGKLNHKKIDMRLKLIAKKLVLFYPPKSLGFLIDVNREENFISTFKKKFVKRVKNAVHYITSNRDIIKGVKMLKGLGFGLTPSGDDFLAGYILGSRLRNRLSLADKIYRLSIGKNKISNTFLYLAKEGLYNEHWKNFLNSLTKTEIHHRSHKSFLVPSARLGVQL